MTATVSSLLLLRTFRGLGDFALVALSSTIYNVSSGRSPAHNTKSRRALVAKAQMRGHVSRSCLVVFSRLVHLRTFA